MVKSSHVLCEFEIASQQIGCCVISTNGSRAHMAKPAQKYNNLYYNRHTYAQNIISFFKTEVYTAFKPPPPKKKSLTNQQRRKASSVLHTLLVL